MKNIKHSIIIASFSLLIGNFNNIFALTENTNTSHIINNIPCINPNKQILSSEVASAITLLNFWGYKISEEDFYDKILLHKDWNYSKDGMMHAADPNSAYVGNARKTTGLNHSFGCYAPVIYNAINKVINHQKHCVINLTGAEIDDICKAYININCPVLIYATYNMTKPTPTHKWKISFINKNSKLKINDIFTWKSLGHCFLINGYNHNSYFITNPLNISTQKSNLAIPKVLLKKRYEEMGKQAITIIPKN